MEHPVAVITDSTASLPDAVVPSGLRLVPLMVQLGARTGRDGIDVTGAQCVSAMIARATVSTSRPTPAVFAAAYQQALDAGAERIVSVHLSAELSGTWDSARLAAQEFGYGVVRVVDSRSAGMGLGFAVLAAARAAAAGAAVGEVQDAAVAAVDRTSCFFYLDTLEYLRRGGRIGAAQAMLGTALSVKPLLYIRDGRIEPLEKVRTSAKAIARLIELASDAAGDAAVEVAVQHFGAPERAEEVTARLRERVPRLGEVLGSQVASAVGVHTGPGTVGIVVSRQPN